MSAPSSLLPNSLWSLPSEFDPVNQYQLKKFHDYRGFETQEQPLFDQQLGLQSPPQAVPFERSASFSTGNSCEPNMVKKLNHNASERDRRKKMNSQYLSLRSLLPPEDQLKKLSIPATVSRVLKYIPDLERETERLIRRKEELTSKISKQNDFTKLQRERNNSNIVGNWSSSLLVSANMVNENEVVIQISILKANQTPLSKILVDLEEDGLFLINASSFESSQRVFYNLHLGTDTGLKLRGPGPHMAIWQQKKL